MIERSTNREFIAKYVESRRPAAEGRAGGATIQLLRLHASAGSGESAYGPRDGAPAEPSLVAAPAPRSGSGRAPYTLSVLSSPKLLARGASRSRTLLTERAGSRGPQSAGASDRDLSATGTGYGAATTGYGSSSSAYEYSGRFRSYSKANSLDLRRRWSAAAPEPSFEHEQLLQEVTAMRALEHLNIVRLVDAFEAPERVVLVMEMCASLLVLCTIHFKYSTME